MPSGGPRGFMRSSDNSERSGGEVKCDARTGESGRTHLVEEHVGDEQGAVRGALRQAVNRPEKGTTAEAYMSSKWPFERNGSTFCAAFRCFSLPVLERT